MYSAFWCPASPSLVKLGLYSNWVTLTHLYDLNSMLRLYPIANLQTTTTSAPCESNGEPMLPKLVYLEDSLIEECSFNFDTDGFPICAAQLTLTYDA